MIEDKVVLEALNEFEQDSSWLKSHKQELSKNYKNTFVAVKDKKIVAFNSALNKLVNKLKKDGFDTSFMVIEYIPEKSVVVIF